MKEREQELMDIFTSEHHQNRSEHSIRISLHPNIFTSEKAQQNQQVTDAHRQNSHINSKNSLDSYATSGIAMTRLG